MELVSLALAQSAQLRALPKDGSSSFTATYTADNVATETLSSYSASVASDISDPESPNDTASGEVKITVTGAATACTLVCPQNINANANTRAEFEALT